jgi:hypothetical protein
MELGLSHQGRTQMVFEDWMRRTAFGSKCEELAGDWRGVHTFHKILLGLAIKEDVMSGKEMKSTYKNMSEYLKEEIIR